MHLHVQLHQGRGVETSHHLPRKGSVLVGWGQSPAPVLPFSDGSLPALLAVQPILGILLGAPELPYTISHRHQTVVLKIPFELSGESQVPSSSEVWGSQRCSCSVKALLGNRLCRIMGLGSAPCWRSRSEPSRDSTQLPHPQHCCLGLGTLQHRLPCCIHSTSSFVPCLPVLPSALKDGGSVTIPSRVTISLVPSTEPHKLYLWGDLPLAQRAGAAWEESSP